MKTQITKENALIIIENAIKQESLLNSLEEIMDSGGSDYDGSISVLDAIFNYGPDQISQDNYDVIWNIFFDKIKGGSRDFKSLAEQVYDETLEFMTKLDKKNSESYWAPKLSSEDALRVIQGDIMRYSLWYNLSNIGFEINNYGSSTKDLLKLLFDNVPDTIECDEMMEIFYLGSEEFAGKVDFTKPVPEDRLNDAAYSIYRKMLREADRQREITTKAA